jgi:ABC-2 type transport system ATP-binding protein
LKIQTPFINPVASVDGGLRVEKVTHYYGNTCVLRSISFEARRGEVSAILGPNGAGKTTLMRVVTGYFLPLEGQVWFGSQELTRHPLSAKRRLGYLPENFPLYPYLTVQGFLSWCLELRGFKGNKLHEMKRVLDLVGLTSREQSLISKLSKGLKQRLGLAQALLGNPDYLILDEPTSGMDPELIREMRELVTKLKKDRTVVLSTHILAEAAQVADRIVILSAGQVIASGRPRELEDAYLQGETLYRIGIRGELSKIEEVLGRLPSIVAFEVSSSLVDYHRFELRIQPHVSEEQFLEHLHQVDLRPFEYYRKELKLEDIYLKALTMERNS